MVARQCGRSGLRRRRRQQHALRQARLAARPCAACGRQRQPTTAFCPISLCPPPSIPASIPVWPSASAARQSFLRLHARAQRRQRRGHSHLCRRRGSDRSKIWRARQSCARSLCHQPSPRQRRLHRCGAGNRATALRSRAAPAAARAARSAIRPLQATILPRAWACPTCRSWSLTSRPPPLRSEHLTSRSPFHRCRRITTTIRRRLSPLRRRSSIPPARAFPRAR